MNLEDNFTKIAEQVLKGVNRQGQKDFSPGGTHRGLFYVIEENCNLDVIEVQ